MEVERRSRTENEEVVNVLVTGATGALGREVVNGLRGSGHRVRVLSRRSGTGGDWVQGNLATGKGIDGAVADMDAVVHAATAGPRFWLWRAVDVDGTRRLLEASRRAHIKHFVYVSNVGTEGVASGYYRTKLAAEAVLAEDIVPCSILRATQFHTLMETYLEAFSKLPRTAAVPFAWLFQPVDPRDVAARVVQITTGSPAGRQPDFGGPEVRTFGSIAQSWLKARRLDKKLVNLPMPGRFSRQLAAGKLLSSDHKDGNTTFEQYLVRRYGRW